MAIRKFVAPTTREAMMQVRRELGDDAVIIANRRVGNRIEILAAAPDAVEALVERSETRAAAPPRENATASDRPVSRDSARPKVEPFQDFVRRQMQSEADAPVPARAPRELRAVPVRAQIQPVQRSLGTSAGVAMYHDVADIEQEELAPPQPAERTPARAPATTLPHSHRAQQVETVVQAPDPAVFRRRPAHVAAQTRAQPPAVTASAAPVAPATPPVDIVLEPQAAPKAAAVAEQKKAHPERNLPARDATIAAGHATVVALPARSQAAPIAIAARLREAWITVAADMAARDAIAAESVAPAAPAAPVAPAPMDQPGPQAAWSWETHFVDASIAPVAPQPAAVAAPVVAQPAPVQAAQPAPIELAPPASVAAPARPAVESQLLAELQSMRDMLRQQLATLASKPASEAIAPGAAATRVVTRLLTAGFSAEVARRIAAHVPPNIDPAQADSWLQEVLAHNIRCAEPSEGIVERAGRPATPGQIFALVGPTGVGKTTTVAKLAARFAVRHGTSALGLITLDAYRVAAPEQLRTYGRILGTPVHTAQDATTLRELLATMVHKRLILIDTCGVSQRDERLNEMLDFLAGAGTANRPVQRVLLLNSASHAETLDEAARAWRAHECAGAILTKLDEATRIGGSLDVSLRHRLNLLGVTNGQRVPEDWHAASSKLLAHLALKPAAQLFELGAVEGAALLQATGGATHAAAHA